MSPERRLRPLVAMAACGLLAAAACSGDAGATGPAPGSDQERPADPADGTVGYTDVAHEVGLDVAHGTYRFGATGDTVSMMTGGVCWIDYDADGWLDLFVTNTWTEGEFNRHAADGAVPRTSLWRNEAGQFRDVTDDTGTGLEVRGQGCVAGDFDLDGRTDLFVTTARENVLLRNDGGDAFVDVTDEAGVDGYGWHTGAAVGDIDGNGWPDLFVSGYANLNAPIPEATQGFPNTYKPVADLLYVNDGPDDDGVPQFREVGEDVGLDPAETSYGLGVALSDLDRDGDLDVHVANDTKANHVYENVVDDASPHGFRLVEIAEDAGLADTGSGMGIAGGDYDSDGADDLVVTNNAQGHVAARNESDTSGLDFSDELAKAFPGGSLGDESTGWGVSWVDVDLDTDLDLLIANGAIPITDIASDGEQLEAFANLGAQGEPGAFEDVASDIGLADLGRVVARGSAAADYDNDGDVDLAVVVLGGDLLLLRNQGAGGHWLGVETDEFAPGTRITAVLPDGSELVRELRSGSSYLSSEDPRAHFGVGSATSVPEVRVTWPDGSQAVLEDVAVDQYVDVTTP